ncbi:gp25 [Shigella phage Buco]|uniref:Uncharacterized protein n=1 Tax=Shigella phage Buco TaxID=2530183 RepID=A0A482JG58_9CAUD|nr:gp25 [Shigella phage Buco]QBP32925.1 hypothetical protein HRP29_gp25 [Shigella phage Buco]
MNLIKILVKLLDKAYHAEARKHQRAADKHAADSQRHHQAAEQLRAQAAAAVGAGVSSARSSELAYNRAKKIQAKAAQVSQFFTV